MGLHRRGQARRQGHRRRRAGYRPGDQRGAPQDHGAPHPVRHHRVHPVRFLHGAGHGGGAGGREGGEARADHGAEVARPRRAALQAQVSPQNPAALRPAHRGRHVPCGQGRHRRHPRALRLGQDGDAAPAGQVVGRGHRGLHRLRRTGQRDDRRAAGVPRAGGPPHRRVADEADGSDRQHLRHAGGRP